MNDIAACFSDDYAQARERFLAACAEAGVATTAYENTDVKGPKGETLATDVAVFGDPKASRMGLVVTGTHGLEGFCGSAIVLNWLRHGAHKQLGDDVGVVVVHAINPWGFAHLRRTTENNVDLNRNFVDHDAPYPENPRYAELHGVVCPSEWSEAALAEAGAKMDAYAAEHGRDKMMDALIRGQYSHADGMNFGGSQREWPNRTMEKIIADHLGHAEHVGLIDWHTGIGDDGQAVYLCFNEDGSPLQARAGDWWGMDNVQPDSAFAGDGRKRPSYKGLVFYGVQQWLPKADMAGAVIEYGTRGGPRMYTALRLDRFLHYETDRWAPANADLLEDLFDAFCPRAAAWREAVLTTSLPIMRAMTEGLARW
ncbi:MAG: M14 family metallopeptidase [Alphaproteobacteria bacterium]